MHGISTATNMSSNKRQCTESPTKPKPTYEELEAKIAKAVKFERKLIGYLDSQGIEWETCHLCHEIWIEEIDADEVVRCCECENMHCAKCLLPCEHCDELVCTDCGSCKCQKDEEEEI